VQRSFAFGDGAVVGASATVARHRTLGGLAVSVPLFIRYAVLLLKRENNYSCPRVVIWTPKHLYGLYELL
jgi:hypothetical protein